jgi:hypothetical protein
MSSGLFRDQDDDEDTKAHQRVCEVIEQNRKAFEADRKGGQLHRGWWYLYADGQRTAGAQSKDALYDIPSAKHAIDHLKPVIFHDAEDPVEQEVCL